LLGAANAVCGGELLFELGVVGGQFSDWAIGKQQE